MKRILIVMAMVVFCAAVAQAQFTPGTPRNADGKIWTTCSEVNNLGIGSMGSTKLEFVNLCYGAGMFDLQFIAWRDDELVLQGFIDRYSSETIIEVPWGSKPPSMEGITRLVFYGTFESVMSPEPDVIWEVEIFNNSELLGQDPGGPGGGDGSPVGPSQMLRMR